LHTNLLAQFDNDAVFGIQLQRLLGDHVRAHRVVAQRLSLHDSLHVGAPAKLARHQAARGRHQTIRQQNLLNLVGKNLLDRVDQILICSLQFLEKKKKKKTTVGFPFRSLIF
jgi:hypothetical protein